LEAPKSNSAYAFIVSLQRLFSHWLLRSVFFWGMLMGFVVVIDDSTNFNFGKIINAAILLFFFWLIVNINYQYLIPRFLNKKKLAVYGILLLMVAGVLAPLRAALFVIITQIFDPGTHYVFSQGLITVFTSLVIVGIISAGLRIFSDWMAYTRVKTEMDQQNLQSELKFLRSQVNPHFLFNTLNSLYALTLKKSDQAPEIVIKLSEMMRYMLYECNEAYVPLYKEINYLKNYIELERLRHGSHIDIKINITGDVNQQRIAPLLFIPFIENSFKHGVSKKIDDGFVHTSLDVKSDSLELTVENSKAPTLPNPERKISGGIGLANVKRRLQLIYPDRHQLRVTDAPHKFNIHLTIKLN
jgi:LytS/YehU family sensor histidine kinase